MAINTDTVFVTGRFIVDEGRFIQVVIWWQSGIDGSAVPEIVGVPRDKLSCLELVRA